MKDDDKILSLLLKGCIACVVCAVVILMWATIFWSRGYE